MKDADKRLGTGSKGLEDIKNHPFFKNIDWEAIYNKKIKPPFVPKISSESDTKYIDSVNIILIKGIYKLYSY